MHDSLLLTSRKQVATERLRVELSLLAVQKMNIDRCFLGACAVSSQLGLGGFNPADALFKRVLLPRQKVTALVTLDKLEPQSPHLIGPLEFVHKLVVPHDISSVATGVCHVIRR